MSNHAVNIGQTEIATLVFISESLVMNAQEMQNGGVEIVNVNGVANNIIAVVVRFAERKPFLDSGSRHENREATWMVIASVVGFRQGTL